MDELFIALDTRMLQALKRIVQIHLKHLDRQVKNFNQFATRSEGDMDADEYFMQALIEEAMAVDELLRHPIRKENGWVKEILEQLAGTNGKHK